MFEGQDILGFTKLFQIHKLSELKNYCRNLVVYAEDLANFALKINETGFQYAPLHRVLIPQNLKITGEDRGKYKAVAQLMSNKSNKEVFKDFLKLKLVTKAQQSLKDRRHLHAHVFFTDRLERWYFFYYDQRDLEPDRNKWKLGAHIHLINYLWPNYDLVDLVKEFWSSRPTFKSALHIQFVENSVRNSHYQETIEL